MEVTVSGNASGLIEKINKRATQWISQLRERLENLKVIEAGWSFHVLVFVRGDQLNWFRGRITEPAADVTVLAIEDAITGWEWNAEVWTSDYAFDRHTLKRAGQRRQ